MFYVRKDIYEEELEAVTDNAEFWRKLSDLAERGKALRAHRMSSYLQIKDELNDYVKIEPDFNRIVVTRN